MAFKETPRFPDDIAYGSSGGPSYLTNIIEYYSGKESRNSVWTYPRHHFNAAYGVRSMSDLEDLIAYFHVAKGRANSFRVKDFADFKSCKTEQTVSALDQVIGAGDGTTGSDGTAAFQLIKTYSSGSTTSRLIQKPVIGTVVVAIDDTPTLYFTVDTTTGIITFTTGHIPLVGEVITAGYEFDVPVRFDTDSLSTELTYYQQGNIDVPLIEVKI
jgi:uncharacterized protein (TIGR02217 family)